MKLSLALSAPIPMSVSIQQLKPVMRKYPSHMTVRNLANAYSLKATPKADLKFGCCITKLGGDPSPGDGDPCKQVFLPCDPQTFVPTCCLDGITFVECQGIAVVKVVWSTPCND